MRKLRSCACSDQAPQQRPLAEVFIRLLSDKEFMPKKSTQLEQSSGATRQKKTSPRDDRKIELIQHAMDCLSAKGYAQTTLRDIAAASGMSLGRLYYYFESKEELITLVVSHYKEEFIVSMMTAFESADTVEQMLEQVIDEYVRTIRSSAKTHRLWYDIRLQALFDEKFREVVEPIQAELRDYIPQLLQKMSEALGDVKIEGVDTEALYLMLDALFFRALQDDVVDNNVACKRFRKSVEELFSATLVPAVRVAESKKKTSARK